jgi:hypothetical protein
MNDEQLDTILEKRMYVDTHEANGKIYFSLDAVKSDLLAWRDAAVQAAQKNLPIPSGDKCYNCGNETFQYDGANRCIYDGYQAALNPQGGTK